MFMAMAKYFTQTGKKPISAIYSGTANDFVKEAKVRHDWWFKKLIYRPDGSTEWSHFMNRKSGGTRWYYSLQTINYIYTLHWNRFYDFADDKVMEGFAKVYYNGVSDSDQDIFDKDNTETMTQLSDGRGGDVPLYMSSASLIGCWDNSGEILSLTEQIIVSPTKHKIKGNTYKHHNSHHNALLSCELKRIYDQ